MQNRRIIERVRPLFSFSLLLAFGVAAVILMFKVTTHGPGVSPDSTIYIETAENILAGRGFVALDEPMVHYPPGYPLLLALDRIFESKDLFTGRILHCILFGVNVMLVGVAAQISTRKNLLAMALAMLAFLCSADAISIHARAWSEVPYITFSLAGLILVSLYLARPGRYMLLASSLAIGAAMLVRYVGVTLLPPMVLGLLFFGTRSKKEKILDAVLATLIASLPLVAWLVRNQLVAGTSTGRMFAVHLVTFNDIKLLVTAIYNFILNINIDWWVQALHVAVLAGFFVGGVVVLHKKNYLRTHINSTHILFPTLGTLYFFTYIVFLLISKSFLNVNMSFDYRMPFPVFFFLLVALISVVWSLSQAFNNRMSWWFFILALLFTLSVNAAPAINTAINIHRKGLGYLVQKWQDSATIAYAKNLDDDVKIYTNGFEAIRFLTKKDALSLPRHNDPGTRLGIAEYPEKLKSLCDGLKQGQAVAIYFNGISRWYLPSADELVSNCGVQLLETLDDGKVYGVGK